MGTSSYSRKLLADKRGEGPDTLRRAAAEVASAGPRVGETRADQGAGKQAGAAAEKKGEAAGDTYGRADAGRETAATPWTPRQSC